jgi:hypothetical protein
VGCGGHLRGLAAQSRVASMVVLVVMLFGRNWIGADTERGRAEPDRGADRAVRGRRPPGTLNELAAEDRLGAEPITTIDHLLRETPLGQRVVNFRSWSP